MTNKPRITADAYFRMTAESTVPTELVDGEIIAMGCPDERHQDIALGLASELRSHIRKNGGTCKAFIAPFDVRLDDDNVVQPDVFVVCDPDKRTGKNISGSPDFVIEIVNSNRRDDFFRKLVLYSEHGVREYWIVDPQHEKTVVYFFEDSNIPDIYTFDTPIPVRIWDNLFSICIADLI